MAEKLDIDIGPGNILQLGNGGLTDGTTRIGAKNYFYDNSGTTTDSRGTLGQLPLEMRYNTNNGIVVLVEPTTSTVLFQSVPGGSSNFTQEGLTLIQNGDLNVGVGTAQKALTTEDVLSVIANESTFASNKWTADAKASNGKQRAPVVNTVLKSATGVGTDGKVQTTVGVTTAPGPGITTSQQNNVFSAIVGKADEWIEQGITFIEDQTKIKFDKLLISGDLNVEFGSDKLESVLKGPFKYPKDAIYDNTQLSQDYIQIVQYSYKPPYKDNIFNKGGAVGILTSGSVRTTPFEKYIGMAKLPMPNSISDSNSVNWGEDQMNDLNTAVLNAFASSPRNVLKSAALGGAASALGLGGMGRLATFLALLNNAGGAGGIQTILGNQNSGALVQTAISSRILAMAGIQVSPESILSRGFGVVPNSNMELLFNSPTLRSFQFSWKLSPRDKNEALEVNKIVRFFKQGMAVKKQTGTSGAAGGRSLFLGTPNIFKLNFKTQGGTDISGVNKIKACAIKSCSVNYTPEQIWASYESGQPVSIQISITVQELEPIYDTDYQEVTDERLFTGAENSTGDLDSVTPNDVGY